MKRTLFLILLCLVGILSSDAQQHLYGLDPTFAINGIYHGDTGVIWKMVVQPDSKILVTGGEIKYKDGAPTAAMRFNSDGSIDSSFAVNGRLFSPVFDRSGSTRLNSVLLQPDGKIVLGGANDTGVTSDDFFLVRLFPNGSLDHSFGGGGYVITGYRNTLAPSAVETISSLALQPDGKILAYGTYDFAQDTLQIVRYHTDGKVDSSFGVDGRVQLYEGFTYPRANDIAVMPDGRIVVGGYGSIDALGSTTSVMAIRLLSDGSLDTSFNHTGLAYTQDNLPGLLYCKAMCLQPDGKVALGIYADSIAVVRFDTSGQLDDSFGTNGLAKLDPAGKVLDMQLQPDGKILLATNPDAITMAYDSCYAIYRVTTDGKKDTGFGINGKVQTRISNEPTMLGTVAVQADGKLLAGGSYVPAGTKYQRIMLARYTPDAALSVGTVDLENNITIFPNPANEYIYIDSSPQRSIQQLALYSFDGKLLLTQSFPHTDQLATKGLADGIYFLKLRLANHQNLTKKIIIQKN